MAGGCHLTRDTPALVAAAGMDVVALEQSYLGGPGVSKPWTYLTSGRAF
jgi:hypothetical protein